MLSSDVSRVNFKVLFDLGVKGVLLDKDNTITSPHQFEIHPLAKVWFFVFFKE
jgi:predicted HAD superfamily phosphohydrolase YqeG